MKINYITLNGLIPLLVFIYQHRTTLINSYLIFAKK